MRLNDGELIIVDNPFAAAQIVSVFLGLVILRTGWVN